MKLRSLIMLTMLGLLSLVSMVNAQIAGGTYRIPGDYATITDATSALTAGVAGPVVFELQSSYTSSGETFPICIPAVAGASVTNTITFRPASDATNLVINSGGLTALLFTNSVEDAADGGDYITFDGQPGGIGGTKQLSFTNSGSMMIKFVNDAKYNKLRYCNIYTTGTATPIYFNYASATGTGNDNNTIEYCDIYGNGATKPGLLISSTNTDGTGKENSGNTIDHCNLYNFAGSNSAAVNLATNNTDWSITNNSIYQPSTITGAAGSYYGITIASGNNHLVSGNYIGGSSSQCGGTAWTVTGTVAARFVGINLAVGTTTATSIQNNIIKNFVWSSSSGATSLPGAWCGIYATAGNVNIGNVTGNTIGSTTGTGSITSTVSTTGGISFGIGSASAGIVNLSNNSIGSITTVGSSTSVSHSFAAIQTTAGSAITIDNNLIGSTSTANSINASTASTSSTGQHVVAILNSFNGTINITNNTIANLNNAGTGTGTTSFKYQTRGIVTTAGTNTVSGNTVHHLASASAYTGSDVDGILAGIQVTSTTGNQVVNNNSVYNLSSSTASAGINMMGIYTTGAVANLNVYNNEIYNFSRISTGYGSTYGIYSKSATTTAENFYNNSIHNISGTGQPTVYGLYCTAGSANRKIYSNNIYTIGAGVNGVVYGIYSYGFTPVLSSVYKNKVYDLSADGTGGQVTGIDVYGTTVYCYNNYITDLKATASTSTVAITGLKFEGGTTCYGFSNTIYLAGTTLTTAISKAIYAYNSTTVDLRNNIAINKITPGASGYAIAYFRSGTTLTNYSAASNNNCFYAGTPSATNLVYYDGTNSKQTMADYKVFVSPRDASSIYEDVSFVNSLATPYDLHVNSSVASQLESGAVVITSPIAITDDFDGDLRNTTKPDIGADEFTGIALDQTAPSVSYTAFNNSSSTTSRLVSNVVITDASGINVASGTKPRIYFTKVATPAFGDWQYAEATETASPFSFTLDYSLIGGVVAGDVVKYFVVAQDLATTPNVAINSGSFAAVPSSVALTSAAFPISGTVNSYTIIGSFSGDINVGTAETYKTISDAVTYLSGSEIVGPVNLLLTDASYTVTSSITIGELAGLSSSNRLTIKPASGMDVTITGSIASASIFWFNGSDYITIDGSNNGSTSRNLTINNTSSTGAAIHFRSMGTGLGATYDVVKNCILKSGANTGGSGISFGTTLLNTASNDNDYITIQNNDISKCGTGIYAYGLSSGTINGLNIIGNIIGNSTDLESVGTIGINLNYCDGATVSQNTIFNLKVGNEPIGMNLNAPITNSEISKNNIYNVKYAGTSGYGARGIKVSGSGTSSSLSFTNNMVSAIGGDGYTSFSGASPVGIYFDGTVTGLNLYFNSVNMTGNLTYNVATLTTALLFNTTSITNIDLRNNLLINSMNNTSANGSTTAKNYAIYSTAPIGSFTNINNNNYYASGTQGIPGFIVNDRTDLAGIQAGFGQNTNSQNSNITFEPSITGDLKYERIAANAAVFNTGTPITGYTTDFYGTARPQYGQVDIGAYELLQSSGLAESAIPVATSLSQNYPNPFNPETTINFALAKDAKVNLTVYNAKGEVVKSLVNSSIQAGYHSVNFNAVGLNSGLYFYKLTTPENSFMKKMILVK